MSHRCLLVLLTLCLVAAGCDGGVTSSAVPDGGGGTSSGRIPAQGPCDEPLLDDDVVAATPAVGALVPVGLVLADGPLYESVEALAAAADLVVRGTVGPVIGQADWLSPSDLVRTVSVSEVLAGGAPQDGLTVVFTLGDTAGERCSPVVEGREVILFLGEAGPDADATHFVLGSHNNAVMTVDGERALVHSWVPGRLWEADAPRSDLSEDGGFPPPGQAFELDEIRAVVADS